MKKLCFHCSNVGRLRAGCLTCDPQRTIRHAKSIEREAYNLLAKAHRMRATLERTKQ